MLHSLKTGDDVDVNILLTSRKKSSEVWEGGRDVGLSADIWATKAFMSWDEITIFRISRSVHDIKINDPASCKERE
jgi:hypothetical protein